MQRVDSFKKFLFSAEVLSGVQLVSSTHSTQINPVNQSRNKKSLAAAPCCSAPSSPPLRLPLSVHTCFLSLPRAAQRGEDGGGCCAAAAAATSKNEDKFHSESDYSYKYCCCCNSDEPLCVLMFALSLSLARISPSCSENPTAAARTRRVSACACSEMHEENET
jgi:hypothetical protein